MQNKYKPQDKYIKANIKRYVLNVNKKTDTDIIECLENQTNKTGFIKDLIREYLENKQKKF
ncbi:MAG: hypothetical protein ACI4TX_02200 [Christensenellales bacterium]